jgi:AcrR family transcriptional regulator
VLEAAQDLMQRYGYKKMTIDDIASEVGIGKATLYGYFANKQEVGLAVIDHYHQEIQDGMFRVHAQDLSACDKLRQMILDRVMYLFDVANRHRQSLDDCLAALRPLVLARRDHYADQQSRILAKVLLAGMEAGEFAWQEPVQLGMTILTCVGGLMPLNLSPKELESRDQVIEKTRLVTDLILRSICRMDQAGDFRTLPPNVSAQNKEVGFFGVSDGFNRSEPVDGVRTPSPELN